eukprot:2575925-Rhodomonas_salina.1
MRAFLFVMFLATSAAFHVGCPVPSFVAKKHAGRLFGHSPIVRAAQSNNLTWLRKRSPNRKTTPSMMWGFLPSEDEMREEEPPPPVIEISTQDELESLLTRGRFVGKLVVVDWYASWCRVCFFLELCNSVLPSESLRTWSVKRWYVFLTLRCVQPRFKKLARQLMDECIFVKVDGLVLEYNDGKAGPGGLKKRVGVTKYPTFQVWKDRYLVAEIVGGDFEPKQFEKNLKELLD